MARLVGCWAGCHGNEGEGGTEVIEGIPRITAPATAHAGAADARGRAAAAKRLRTRSRYLASVICPQCHGLECKRHALEGGPSLAVVAIYGPDEFRSLLHAGKPIVRRDFPKMAWMADAGCTDQEINDLYAFPRAYHRLPPRAIQARKAEGRPTIGPAFCSCWLGD
jgi:cytochrome c553